MGAWTWGKNRQAHFYPLPGKGRKKKSPILRLANWNDKNKCPGFSDDLHVHQVDDSSKHHHCRTTGEKDHPQIAASGNRTIRFSVRARSLRRLDSPWETSLCVLWSRHPLVEPESSPLCANILGPSQPPERLPSHTLPFCGEQGPLLGGP